MRYFALSDVGKRRKENQDSWLSYTNTDAGEFSLVVCDGMGGENAGRTASVLAAESFIEHIRACLRLTKRAAPDTIIRDAASYANIRLYDHAFQRPECRGMGTTLVAALLLGSMTAIINIGDSRAYLLERDGEITRVTNDHSFVEELVARGKLTREQAKKHPRRNEITRALGVEPEVKSDVFLLNPEAGDRILLCTDGLSNQLSDEEIAAFIRDAETPRDACRTLVDAVLDRGAPDNVTAAVLFID